MPLLEVDHLSVRFRGLVAVNDVSFTVDRGDFVSIIGPNGAGKTTLFNVVAGAQSASSGEVRFSRQSTRRMDAGQMSRLGVGRTFQIARPFKSLTVRENVQLAAARRETNSPILTFSLRRQNREVRETVEAVLEETGLHAFANTSASDLNMGNLRRLEIARALATEPQVLLLDEPAAGIGIDGIRPLAHLIREIRRRGLTVLLVEHHIGFALSLSDRIVVLDGGRKIAEGEPETIRNDQRVIDAYLGTAVEEAGRGG
ncbi:MAG: ABC transporter ATP-binding protein [Chloroflexota bacterium]